MDRTHRTRRCALGLAGALPLLLVACGPTAAADLEGKIVPLEQATVDLPEVPTLPEPPYPVQYDDERESYSIYGLRRRSATTMSQQLWVTGYVVAIYRREECPEGQTCPPASAPHFFLADAQEPAEDEGTLLVTGYAQSQQEVDEILEEIERDRYEYNPESGSLPFPVGLGVGAKVRVEGQFTRISSFGFTATNGMLDYRNFEVIEPAPEAEEEEEAPRRRRR